MPMREGSNRLPTVLVGLLMVCLLLPLPAGAELSTEEQLAEEGLPLLALRNDTIDTNQDGDIDAVRVVVVRCTAIDQLVKTENVFQLNVVIQLIRQV